MHTTRLSLIDQLGGGDPSAWMELDRLYRPLIHNWLRRFPLQSCDVDDITQDVMTVVIRDISNFEHSGRIGAFRNWLRTTTVNLARNHIRRQNAMSAGSDAIQSMLAELEDPGSPLSKQFDQEHDRAVVGKLLDQLARQFEPITVEIFQLHVVQAVGAQETAAKLNVSVASVHTAKSRVLRRLRQDAAHWIDDLYFS